MSLTSEEPNTADHESSSEHFFLKEDNKDQRSSEDEDEGKDENENKSDVAHTNIFAALAALQTGQLTLSQVGNISLIKFTFTFLCCRCSLLSLQDCGKANWRPWQRRWIRSRAERAAGPPWTLSPCRKLSYNNNRLFSYKYKISWCSSKVDLTLHWICQAPILSYQLICPKVLWRLPGAPGVPVHLWRTRARTKCCRFENNSRQFLQYNSLLFRIFLKARICWSTLSCERTHSTRPLPRPQAWPAPPSPCRGPSRASPTQHRGYRVTRDPSLRWADSHNMVC